MPAEDGGSQWEDAWMPPLLAEPLPEGGSSAACQNQPDVGKPLPSGDSGQFDLI